MNPFLMYMEKAAASLYGEATSGMIRSLGHAAHDAMMPAERVHSLAKGFSRHLESGGKADAWLDHASRQGIPEEALRPIRNAAKVSGPSTPGPFKMVPEDAAHPHTSRQSDPSRGSSPPAGDAHATGNGQHSYPLHHASGAPEPRTTPGTFSMDTKSQRLANIQDSSDKLKAGAPAAAPVNDHARAMADEQARRADAWQAQRTKAPANTTALPPITQRPPAVPASSPSDRLSHIQEQSDKLRKGAPKDPARAVADEQAQRADAWHAQQTHFPSNKTPPTAPPEPAPTQTTAPAGPAPTQTTAPAGPAPTQTTAPAGPAPTQTTAPAGPASTQTTAPAGPAPTQTTAPAGDPSTPEKETKTKGKDTDTNNFWGHLSGNNSQNVLRQTLSQAGHDSEGIEKHMKEMNGMDHTQKLEHLKAMGADTSRYEDSVRAQSTARIGTAIGGAGVAAGGYLAGSNSQQKQASINPYTKRMRKMAHEMGYLGDIMSAIGHDSAEDTEQVVHHLSPTRAPVASIHDSAKSNTFGGHLTGSHVQDVIHHTVSKFVAGKGGSDADVAHHMKLMSSMGHDQKMEYMSQHGMATGDVKDAASSRNLHRMGVAGAATAGVAGGAILGSATS